MVDGDGEGMDDSLGNNDLCPSSRIGGKYVGEAISFIARNAIVLVVRAETAVAALHINDERRAYRNVSGIDGVVEVVVVVVAVDVNLLDGTFMKEWLDDAPEGGEDARDVHNEGPTTSSEEERGILMHGLRVVVRGDMGHSLEVADELASSWRGTREGYGDTKLRLTPPMS